MESIIVFAIEVATLSGGLLFCPVSGICLFRLRKGVFH